MSEADLATTAAQEEAKRFQEASDKVRERSDAAAKGLAALGTAGLTAIGIAKFSDIYPFPPGQGGWLVAVFAGFLAMAFVLTAFTFRLWNANRPLVMSVDGKMDLGSDEAPKVQEIYDATAARHGVKTLRAYAARGERLERIADRTPEATRATAIRTMAERVRANVELAKTRGQLVVIRGRMNRALTGFWAIAYAVIFVLGLFAFGIGVDRLDSERSARAAAYKACTELVAAHVSDAKLPRSAAISSQRIRRTPHGRSGPRSQRSRRSAPSTGRASIRPSKRSGR